MRIARGSGWLWLGIVLLRTIPAGAEATDADRARTPLARLHGETLYRDEVQGAVAFRLYRMEVDAWSLLKTQTEERVERELLEREAKRRGLEVDALLAAVMDGASEVSDAEVDRYLREHPAEARSASTGDVRERVRLYLSERARLERRIALVERLRSEAGYEFLLPPPVPPRTEVEVDGAPSRGPETADVTIVHFANPMSRSSTRSAERIDALRRRFPERIRHVHRSFLNGRDERGLAAARLAAVATSAAQFWDLHDRLVGAGGKLPLDQLEGLARDAGYGDPQIARARQPESARAVRRDMAAAERVGVLREPSIFVNGRYVPGIGRDEELAAVVYEELGIEE